MNLIENVGVVHRRGNDLRKFVLKIVFKEKIEDKKKKAAFIEKYFDGKWIVEYMGWTKLPIRLIPTKVDLFKFKDRE
jgi:hypothetical protein